LIGSTMRTGKITMCFPHHCRMLSTFTLFRFVQDYFNFVSVVIVVVIIVCVVVDKIVIR
jgi:hypothetical protein